MSYTPGPWSYQEGSDSYTHIVRGPNNYFVCQFSQHVGDPTQANARLTAAAPELLGACKAVQPYLLAGDDELHALLESVIAKAEGRS